MASVICQPLSSIVWLEYNEHAVIRCILDKPLVRNLVTGVPLVDFIVIVIVIHILHRKLYVGLGPADSRDEIPQACLTRIATPPPMRLAIAVVVVLSRRYTSHPVSLGGSRCRYRGYSRVLGNNTRRPTPSTSPWSKRYELCLDPRKW